MSVASTETSALDKASMILGTAMMLSWTFAIGIPGLAVLLAIAYALVTETHALAIVCVCLLLAPLFLTVLWGAFRIAATLEERWAPAHSASGPTWWERRGEHRVIYQAYCF